LQIGFAVFKTPGLAKKQKTFFKNQLLKNMSNFEIKLLLARKRYRVEGLAQLRVR